MHATAARFGVFARQITRWDDARSTTVTLAVPVTSSVFGERNGSRYQMTKAFVCEIDWSGHRYGLNALINAVKTLTERVQQLEAKP
jgi:hypothetical protein